MKILHLCYFALMQISSIRSFIGQLLFNHHMKPSYEDMWLTNQNPTVSPQLYIDQNKQNKRRPKFIASNTKLKYPKIPKVNIVSPVQQALIKIKDFKKSLFQDIFPVPNAQVSQDYSSTIEGTKEIPITGGATKLNLQSNFVNFRPSLSDPLRPDVLQVNAPASGMNTFQVSSQ